MHNTIFDNDFFEDNIDIYYLAMLLLLSNEHKTFSRIPELCLVLDEDNLQRFLSVYGGQTIKVPTKEKFNSYLKTVLVYYYVKIVGLSKKEALKKAHATADRDVYNHYIQLCNTIDKLKGVHKDDK